MESVKAYPGVGLGTVEYYYMRRRVQVNLEMPKMAGVHSVYECTDVTRGMKCDYKITIRNAQHENRVAEYKVSGSHSHAHDIREYVAAEFRAMLFYDVETDLDLDISYEQLYIKLLERRQLNVTQVDSLGELTKALDARRSSSKDRGKARPWNMMVTRIPKSRSEEPPLQKFADVHLNDFNPHSQPPWAPALGFPNDRICIVCCDASPCIAVVGCGHIVLCYSCAVTLRASQMKGCPYCSSSTLDLSGKDQLQVIW